MRTGKIPEAVLRRSVLRRIHADSSVRCTEFSGEDCALFAWEQGKERAWMTAYASVCTVPGFERRPGKLVLAAANNLWAGGAHPEALMLQALIPSWYEERDLQRDMDEIAAEAAAQEMRILGGHTQVSDAVKEAVCTVTGIGTMETASRAKEQPGSRRPLLPGDELVVTKWIALGGTAALALNYGEKLKSRYPRVLIDRAKEFEKLMSVAKDARAVNHFGQAAVHDLSQGGIFGALREMTEHAGVGLEVDLRKIPVKQETIEICEYFDVNPYELYSAGSLLVGTEQGEALVRHLARCSVPAAVIGRATDGKDRIILNGEDRRYLDRAPQDAWYKRKEP